MAAGRAASPGQTAARAPAAPAGRGSRAALSPAGPQARVLEGASSPPSSRWAGGSGAGECERHVYPRRHPLSAVAGGEQGNVQLQRPRTPAVSPEGAGPTVPRQAWGVPPERPAHAGVLLPPGEGARGARPHPPDLTVAVGVGTQGPGRTRTAGSGSSPSSSRGVAAFRCRRRQRDGPPRPSGPLHCLLQTPARFQPRLIVEKQTPDMSVDMPFSTSDR